MEQILGRERVLLRRVTLHIKQQNWFAVLLDFLIVVMGVFIGVQVANWNETEKQRRLYSDAFDRVKLEISRNIEELRKAQKYYRSHLPAVQHALEILRSCGENGGTIEEVEATFPYVLNYTEVSISKRDLDLLLSNNTFLIFQDPAVRARLSELSNDVEFINREMRKKVELLQNTDFLTSLETGPLEGSPDENMLAIQNGALPSQELMRKHHFGKPMAEVCKDKSILRKYYEWEEAVYVQIIFGKSAINGFEKELAYFESVSSESI